MSILILGMVIFFSIHLVPSFAGLRRFAYSSLPIWRGSAAVILVVVGRLPWTDIIAAFRPAYNGQPKNGFRQENIQWEKANSSTGLRRF